jgi:hypothetical protein
MARNKGTFNFSNNFEVLNKAPLDARIVVGTKANLIDPSIWRDAANLVWLYKGIVVSVTSDTSTDNNGLYFLTDETQYTDYNYWVKLGAATAADASGTSWSTFQLNNDASGVTLVDVSGNLQIQTPDGSLANFTAADITIDGSLKIDNLTGALYAQNGNVYVGVPTAILTFDGSFIGNDLTVDFSVNHMLNTMRQNIEIWDSSSNETIYPGITKGLNIDYISFYTPPTTGTIYNITILGF